ncbi:hypothetical protein, conserved [Eimeria acervulina]|uniref:HRDC domain-containing protein n=1 Tax=Eimeria acervulina TaxID=5801 RepID=U6GIX0_EIMAC|nr:hypothetical protein, conserved [Eimeria acervulina]CDI78529.1 hypothetical protein, conserved [Eimeria acervulina]
MKVREELAKKMSLKTTKSIATNASIYAIAKALPSSVAQLQKLPFKELHGDKKGQKYGQVFVAEVRAFLCENRLTHLLREDTRASPPPGVSSSACVPSPDEGPEEFISVGGPQGGPPGGPPLDVTDACISQRYWQQDIKGPPGAPWGAPGGPPRGPPGGATGGPPGGATGGPPGGPVGGTPGGPPGGPPGGAPPPDPQMWGPEDLDCLDSF